MSARLLLYVSRAGASLARWEGGRLREIRALPADAEGWGVLSDTLRRAPGMPVYVAVDTVEEYYRSEVLPRVWGRDRREMTERRLRQLLHQTPYWVVLPQDPARDGRIGRHYLFMGLTAPELLQPWVEVMRLRGARLAGIWLLPVLCQDLLVRFHLAPRRARRLEVVRDRLLGRQAPGGTASDDGERLLLVTEQTGGLRLTYFDHGELRFSRLAPLEGRTPDDPLAAYAAQIERTRQSLLAQRLLNRGEPLRVCLLDPLNTLAGLSQRLPGDAGWRCEILPRQRLLAGLGLPPALLTESSDALALTLLARPPAGGNLLPEDDRRTQRQHRLRRAIRPAATLWLIAALGLSLALLLDAWRLSRAADTLQARARQAQQEAGRMLDREGGGARFEARWQTHAAWRWVMAHRADPAATLARIAAIFAQLPAIRLSHLRWSGPDTAQPPRLTLEGEVMGFGGDYRLAHDRIEALAAALRRDGWQAEVTRWPLDVAPHLEIQGDLGRDAGDRPARFALALTAAGRVTPAGGRASTSDLDAGRSGGTAP